MRLKPENGFSSVEIDEADMMSGIVSLYAFSNELVKAQGMCGSCALAISKQCSRITENGVAIAYVPRNMTYSKEPEFPQFPHLGKKPIAEPYEQAIQRVRGLANCAK